ncbi:MAG: metallophosphoesterase [Candidatus Absconditicoccaceae bacterium]
MIILFVIRLGFGIYKGTTTKLTPLHISNNRITNPYTIVFISDIHVDSIRNQKYIQSIVNKINKIKPDFVLLGGDLMNTAKSSYVDAFLPFNQLDIPIYATLGNHDHMGNSGSISQIFEKTNIIALRNQSIEISGLQIVGIDDKSYRGNKKLDDILQESKISDNGSYTILISHQPQKLIKLSGHPIHLELAGHTHNGQFIPFSWIIGLFNDYAYGKYNYNDMTAFVSQGIGSRGAPIRIGTQSELVIISLTPKTK